MNKEIIDAYNKFLESNSLKINYIIQFLFVVIVYGFIINFALSQFFPLPFTIKSILATGILAYIIKVELPVIVSSSIPKFQPPSNL